MASAHRPIFRCRSRAYMWSVHHSCFISPRSVSADPDDRIGNEFELRNMHVFGGRTATNTTSGVVMRTMAWAEPPAEGTRFPKRHTAQMGADPNHNHPVLFSLTSRASDICRFSIGRKVSITRQRILKVTQSCALRFLNLLSGTVPDKYRLAAPFNRQGCAFREGRNVNLNGRCGKRRS